MPRIRAVILDFDGLILDTESPVYEAWCQIYLDHGLELPREKWSEGIGTDRAGFDPLAHLRSLVTSPLEESGLQRRRRQIRDRTLESLPPMVGVIDCLDRARERGLGLAVASSSPSEWVRGHLERLRLLHLLDAVVTEDDVSAVKPAPDLYLKALSVLGGGTSRIHRAGRLAPWRGIGRGGRCLLHRGAGAHDRGPGLPPCQPGVAVAGRSAPRRIDPAGRGANISTGRLEGALAQAARPRSPRFRGYFGFREE